MLQKQNNQTTALTSLITGKLPPQNIEFEEAVLGALLIDTEAINKVYEILKPESFYKPAHVEIYEAICNLFAVMSKIDMLTVTQELRRMGKIDMVGGAVYVMRLTNRVSSSAHIEAHAIVLQELTIKRELIAESNEILELAFDDTTDAFSLLEKVEKISAKVVFSNISKTEKSLLQYTNDMFFGFENTSVSTTFSGIRELDNITGGMCAGDLIIWGARPAMGKTTEAMAVARNIAIRGENVGFISLEMTGVQLAMRNGLSEFYALNLQNEGYGYPNVTNMRTGNLSYKEKEGLKLAISQSVHLLNVHVNESPSMNFQKIASQARKWKREHNIKALVIDYLQLIKLPKGKQDTRTTEIEDLCYDLKGLAKEIDTPIIALSQLSRAVESRADKRPQLSDLRDSGGIEQSADIVMFPYRPEYYGFMQDEAGNSTKNLLINIVAKNRNGKTGDVNLHIDLEKNLISDWQETFAGINTKENKNDNIPDWITK